MSANLLAHGVEPVADLVFNHRDGSQRWADFKNPDWGTWAITRDDEAFTDPGSDVYGTPENERGAAEERPVEYARHGRPTFRYGGVLGIDHSSQPLCRRLDRHPVEIQ